jgi:hypothetical protein
MVLQRYLPRLQTASQESLLLGHFSYDEDHSIPERSKSESAIISTAHGSSKILPSFPCSLSFETNAKVYVSCGNWHKCKYEEERDWQGRITGNGIHGSLNALMIKYKNLALRRDTPLMGLLTTCVRCCGAPDWFDTDRLDQVVKETPGSLVLGLSGEEVEEVVFSKAIIMEGILMDTIKTVGKDGQRKEWYMLRALFKL